MSGAGIDWSTLGGAAAELYARVMVPAVFEPWAAELVARAGLRPGERVLDLACGTGVVARLAAARVGPAGTVAGLDVSRPMLEQARAGDPGGRVDWREGSALELPWPAGAFQVVLCQQGLQYFPDRLAALREARRVLVAGGRLALAALCASEGHAALAEVARERLGPEAAALVLEPVAFSDGPAIAALVERAGFRRVELARVARAARFDSAAPYVGFVMASRLMPATAALTQEARRELGETFCRALGPFGQPGGALSFVMESHLLTAAS